MNHREGAKNAKEEKRGKFSPVLVKLYYLSRITPLLLA